MQRENLIWVIVLAIGAVLLGARAMIGDGMGRAYVTPEPHSFVQVDDPGDDSGDLVWMDENAAIEAGVDVSGVADDARVGWTSHANTTYRRFLADPAGTHQFSMSRTVGTWIAALFTLFVFSFLIKDNPLYKIAESVFIGVSAAYWMVVGWWDTVVPNLIGKLAPDMVKAWALPGLAEDSAVEWTYIVPLILGGMLLWRLSHVGGWISRWPMAFIIGVFCGLRLVTFLHADFLSQIRNGIMPLWAETNGAFDFWKSLEAVFLLIGVLSCLVYFFFSIEHKGVVGKTARLGIWFLMITFGAAFGYTVMGRIALLAIRLEFIFDDWLWLIDPGNRRIVEDAAAMLMFFF